MARSYAHKWGQIIGNIVQLSVRDVLQEVADRHGLYLDYQRDRPARPGKKVAWQDRNANLHDLDYVLERGGTDTVRGLPAAFIETAWRRYTKHSRNKAQEIQGAVLALAETYRHLRPFLGIVLAGVFTKGSIDQLRSCGFAVAYIPYEVIRQAFATVRIDAAFGEDTAEEEFEEKVNRFADLTPRQLGRVKKALLKGARDEGLAMAPFLVSLEASLSRGIQGVTVVVLHGQPQNLGTAAEAIGFLETYADLLSCASPATRYEIHIRYNTGDVIDATFQRKDDAIVFLRTFT